MRLLPALLAVTLTIAVGGLVRAQQLDAPPSARDARVIIFFAWDRPVIDGDAAARLDDVAAVFRRSPRDLIVAGHADRSGPAGANVRSARKRAEAVALYLAARGVPSAAMRVISYGEVRPLIATQDGVREPQNRRVEVTPAPGA